MDPVYGRSGADILIGTSRGRSLVDSEFLRFGADTIPFVAKYKKGGKLSQLLGMAVGEIKKFPLSKREDVHVYFLAGMPDTTHVKHSWDWSYQEVIMVGTVEEVTSRVKDTIEHVSEIVKSHGAKPCFCTISPMHFQRWNTVRLNDHKVTTHLKHQDQYHSMQMAHQETCTILNQFIYETNRENDMETPKIAEVVFKSQHARRPPRFKHYRLTDGVHPDDCVATGWTHEIVKTMLNNAVRRRHSYKFSA